MYCSHCGTLAREGNRFCHQCGMPVGCACRACGAWCLPGDRFCGNCGSPLVPGAVRPQLSPPGAWGPPPTQALPYPAYVPPPAAPPVPIGAGMAAPPVWGPAAGTPLGSVGPWAAAPPEYAPPAPTIEEPVAAADERLMDLQSRASQETRDRAKSEWLAASEGERRRATILLADMTGSTAVAEKIDHEDMSRIRGAMLDIFARVAMDKYGGWVTNTWGDAFIVTFGAPIAVEDAPERAVRAALEIQEALEAFNPPGVDLHGAKIRMRIGVNEGEVTAGGILADGSRRFDVLGEPVNLAARLEQAAPVGGVLVSQAIRDRVGESFEFEATGPLDLKNVAQPVQAYIVKGLLRREARLDRSIRFGLSKMIGRARHKRTLVDLLEVAQGGKGQIVSITGEGGVGKSRLVLETRADAEALGFRIVEGMCLSFGHNIAYLPLRDAVRNATGTDELDPEETQRESLTRFLGELGCAALAPALGALLELDFPGSDFGVLAPSQRQAAVAGAFGDFVAALAARQPLVLVIDDLQWLDASSETVLKSLVERLADQSVLLVFVHRLDYAPFWEEAPNVTRIELNRLNDGESKDLLADCIEHRALPDHIRNEILERAAGNPFFLEEIVRSLVVTGEIDKAPDQISLDAIPGSLSDMVMARIDRLSTPGRSVLHLAAVMGQKIGRRILETVLGAHAEDVAEALRELQEHRFLKSRGEADEFDFEQQFTRDVAYRSILRRRRHELHVRMAEAMESVYAQSLNAQLGFIARHYEEADRPELAITCLSQGIVTDLLRGNYDLVIENSERAIRLTGQLGDDPAYLAVRGWLYYNEAAGRAQRGEPRRAIEDARRGLEAALESGALDIEARCHIYLGYGYSKVGDFARASEYYRLAAEMFERMDNEDGIRDGLYHGAYVLHERGDYEGSAQLYRQFVASQRDRPGASLSFMIAALVNLGSCLEKLDQYDEALEYYSEAEVYIERARKAEETSGLHGDVLGIAFLKANVGLVNFALGRHRRALEGFDAALEHFDKYKIRDMRSAMLKDVARCHAELGQYDFALHKARQAREEASAVSFHQVEIEALMCEANVANRLGNSSEAAELAKKSVEQADHIELASLRSEARLVLGYALLYRGDSAEVSELLETSIRLAQEAQSRRLRANALIGLAFARLAARDQEDAIRAFQEARRLADAIRAGLPLAESHLGLARAYVEIGEQERAREYFQQATDLAREIEHPETLWRSYAGLARLDRGAGRYQEALASYMKAVASLRPIAANVASAGGRRSPRDALIELQAETAGTLLEAGTVQNAPPGLAPELLALVQTEPSSDAVRDRSPEVTTLFEQLVAEAGLDADDLALG